MTQKKKILEYTRTHKDGISQLDATYKFGITRLGAVIFDLRKLGYVYHNDTVYVTHEDGTKTHYDRYILDSEKSKGALKI